MSRQVYQEGPFKVYRAGNDFIVHNALYAFGQKHTHIKTLNCAKQLINSLKKKSIPRSFSAYLLTSLLRLSDDDKYSHAIEVLIETRSSKGPRPKYQNHCGLRV